MAKVKVKVLESFIGNSDEVKEYGNVNGVIPWANHHPFAAHYQQNYIELDPKRAEELAKEKIVHILTADELKAAEAKEKAAKPVDKPAPEAKDK